MKRTRAIIACFAALVINLQAANILCVGLNEYADYKNLTYAENDAVEVAKFFKAMGHEVTLLTGEAVSRETVLASIKETPEFVYFAGHGEDGNLILGDGIIELSKIATADTMFLLDCCFVGRGLKAQGTMKILAAAEYHAYESDGHGLFTKYLLSWLKDGKEIVGDALTTYLTKNIKEETGGWQKPVLGYI
jgi:hypothetical protein